MIKITRKNCRGYIAKRLNVIQLVRRLRLVKVFLANKAIKANKLAQGSMPKLLEKMEKMCAQESEIDSILSLY